MLLLRKGLLCKSKQTSIHLIPLSLQMRQDKAKGWWVLTLKHPFPEKSTKPCHEECGLESSALLALRATQALTTHWWLVKLLLYIYSVSAWLGFLWLTSHIHCVSLSHAFYLDISCSPILLKQKRVKLFLFLHFLLVLWENHMNMISCTPSTNSLQIHTLFLLNQHCILLYFKTHQVPIMLPMYSWIHGHPLECGLHTRCYSFKKNDPSSPRNH